MRTLNLGILAHVDAGKTTLTERLLHAAGIIDEIGSVDDGNTHTDTLALERQRGITIKSAVVSFVIDDVTVNLIDTPGHPDFIAEVERVLNVLDGAVLVVSAVEGVQAQTRVLMRTLQRLKVPTLIFVNKIDRAGARPEAVIDDITRKLTPAAISMGFVSEPGARGAQFAPFTADDDRFTARLLELLADHDDALLAAYVDGDTYPPFQQLRRVMAGQTAQALVHPVFSGSAMTGAGADVLVPAIAELLPAVEGDPEGPVSGTVFKVDRGPAGEKIAYVRMFSGSVHVRDRLTFGQDREGKVTAISVFDRGTVERTDSVGPGRIGMVWGLGDIRIGDAVGIPAADSEQHYFAPPTLETVVVPHRDRDRGILRAALTQLAEQDPLINVRQDDIRQEMSLSLYGEVQKEVIQATLAGDYGVDVDFRESTTICIERPVSTGWAMEVLRQEPNPFLATIGLRVEPAPVGTGVSFGIEFELGALPPAFLKAVEETVHETLREGIHGWEVADIRVTMTHSGYAPRQSHAHQGFAKSMSSTAGDFRSLTPLVLMDALKEAGTRVYEPIHRFRLEIPANTLGAVLPLLARFRAVPHTPAAHGPSYVLEGDVPAAQVHGLHQAIPVATSGEGMLESAFHHYQPVTGTVPARSRTDHNPLNRKEYLLHVQRRV